MHPYSSVNVFNRQVSLTSPPPTDSTGKPVLKDETITHETFFSVLDMEMAKVEKFTLSQVTELRTGLTNIERMVEGISSEEDKVAVQNEVRAQ